MKKKVALTAAAVALVGTLAVGGTLAWFTDTETATNVVTTGNVDVKITENEPSQEEKDKNGYTADVIYDTEKNATGIEYGNIEPGTIIQKDPVIQYVGKSDAFVRYMINVEGINAEKNLQFIRLENGVEIDVTDSIVPMLGKYYYPVEIFETNDYVTHGEEVTDPMSLFTNIKFVGGNEMTDLENISITIKADAIQADNVDAYDAAGNVDEIKLKALFETEDNNKALVTYKNHSEVATLPQATKGE